MAKTEKVTSPVDETRRREEARREAHRQAGKEAKNLIVHRPVLS